MRLRCEVTWRAVSVSKWDGRGVFRVVYGSVMGNARLHVDVDVAGEFELGSREELGLDVTLTSAWCVGCVPYSMHTSLTTNNSCLSIVNCYSFSSYHVFT